MPDSAVGTQLRALRLSGGFTLEQLAEASGISLRAISDIERGIRVRPRRSTIDTLGKALGIGAAERKNLARALAAQLGAERADRVTQPQPIDDFVGRAKELDAIVRQLSGSMDDGPRVVVVTGAPGVGKTTLALEATRLVAGEGSVPLYVDLLGPNPAAGRSALSTLQSLLAQVLGDDDDPPASLDACASLWEAKCAEHERVVLLDNAADEAQLPPVLAGGNLRVVVTSRRALGALDNVERVQLDPLPSSDGILLLSAIVPEPQRTPEDIRELAALCGDLPLAMRIAANRIASRSSTTAADFARRLRSEDRRLRLLVAGDLSAEAAFRVSFDELDSFSARLYRELSVIDGIVFDAQLVAAIVSADERDVEESLDDLVDLGLLQPVGSARYRLHDLLRTFAASELRREDPEPGEGPRGRLRNWLLSSATAAGNQFLPDAQAGRPGVPQWLTGRDAANAWLRRNAEHWWPAYVQAARLGHHGEVIALADALHWYSDHWVAYGRWQAVCEVSVASARSLGDKRVEAMQLGLLAWTELIERGDPATAILRADEAALTATEAADDAALAAALYYKGYAQLYLAEHEAATLTLSEAARLFDLVEDLGYSMQARSLTAGALLSLDRPADAIEISEVIVAEATRADEGKEEPVWRITVVVAQLRIAECLLLLDRAEDAWVAANQARLVAEADDWSLGLGRVHYILARVAIALGNTGDAEIAITRGLEYAVANLAAGAIAESLRDALVKLREKLAA